MVKLQQWLSRESSNYHGSVHILDVDPGNSSPGTKSVERCPRTHVHSSRILRQPFVQGHLSISRVGATLFRLYPHLSTLLVFASCSACQSLEYATYCQQAE